MYYHWDIVAVVCCCSLAVLLISLSIFFRARLVQQYRRIFQKQMQAQSKLPKSLQRAITELERVTDYRGRRSEPRDCAEGECPICLASLYSILEESDSIEERAVDLEAGLSLATSRTSTATCSAATKHGAKAWRPQPIDDEVLKMKRCQHMFHARCLATWFLRRRYDCPVCRTPYYQPVEEIVERRGESDYHPSLLIAPFF